MRLHIVEALESLEYSINQYNHAFIWTVRMIMRQ